MIASRIPDAARRLAGAVFLVGGVAVFCGVLAHWTWRALEPARVPQVAAPITDWSASILSGPAFGFARGAPASAPNAATAAASPIAGRVRLLGIARESARQGGDQALFRIDQKRILWIKVGESLEPGIVLDAVEPNGVRLSQNGQAISLPLREPRAAPPRAASALPASGVPAGPRPIGSSASPAATRAATADTCKLSPEQRTRAYVLRPEIVETVTRERTGWSDLFKPTAEGLVVVNPGGTGAMLGLYANDLLVQAAGARLTGPDDVLKLMLEPLSRSESVVVTGSRGGQAREWIYTGMNCAQR